MVATLDQAAIRLDLRSTQGDPLGLACLGRNGAGLAGSYQVLSPGTAAAHKLIVESMAFVIVPGLIAADKSFVPGDGPDARYTWTLDDTTLLPAGTYRWQCKLGVTRYGGWWRVEIGAGS